MDIPQQQGFCSHFKDKYEKNEVIIPKCGRKKSPVNGTKYRGSVKIKMYIFLVQSPIPYCFIKNSAHDQSFVFNVLTLGAIGKQIQDVGSSDYQESSTLSVSDENIDIVL